MFFKKGEVLFTCAPVTCVERNPYATSNQSSENLEINLFKMTELNDEQRGFSKNLKICFPVPVMTLAEQS